MHPYPSLSPSSASSPEFCILYSGSQELLSLALAPPGRASLQLNQAAPGNIVPQGACSHAPCPTTLMPGFPQPIQATPSPLASPNNPSPAPSNPISPVRKCSLRSRIKVRPSWSSPLHTSPSRHRHIANRRPPYGFVHESCHSGPSAPPRHLEIYGAFRAPLPKDPQPCIPYPSSTLPSPPRNELIPAHALPAMTPVPPPPLSAP